ncbi:nitrile hydratase accessory protein [Thioalkalivibrio sp. HK1]|uniref:nitrile hydratase accessory protein n=1 Tax=Thioalkalivibrio sp. HK1 TaxID=1469245 RepID=UPI00047039D4|nr:nitrile hydratase accessory protein [Thioalkalivibrio sp. HK1]
MASAIADLESLPAIPRDDDGPLFQAPWEAQAFAMVVALHERGVFTWQRWADALAREIASADGSSKPKGYYEHWLAALEGLLAEVELISFEQREARRSQWEAAAIASPHGEPIRLLDDLKKR